MHVILMGQEDTKRTLYFQKAAEDLKKDVRFIPLSKKGIEEVYKLSMLYPDELVIKIDPLSYGESEVSKLPQLIEEYERLLIALESIPNLYFLNKPRAILDTLDKLVCKKRLVDKGVKITPFYDVTVKNISQLRSIVKEKKAYQLFIKVNNGSGAAGIVAYKHHPRMKEEKIFTALKYERGKIYNTKVLRQVTNQREIEQILNKLLEQEVIIERWMPKARHNDLFYDLRVVWQFGKIEKIIARQSAGPITNLHLNNQALQIEKLELSQKLIEQIEETCKEAMQLFPGLNMAGIDILVSPDEKQIRIIEINGQGDLIYADIYKDNQIYRKQIERMSQNE